MWSLKSSNRFVYLANRSKMRCLMFWLSMILLLPPFSHSSRSETGLKFHDQI